MKQNTSWNLPIASVTSLQLAVLTSYRPISNISFTSKVVERTAASRFVRQAEDNHLFPTRQSSYRRGHSTKTAMLCMYNDLIRAVDSKLVTALVLLDLSSAFDTVSTTPHCWLSLIGVLVFESLQWIGFHLTCLTGFRPSVPMVWCQDQYSLCWAQCSLFHIQKTSCWFSTVKSIIIYMLITSRPTWAYLSTMCYWRVKHLNVVSVTSPRGAHHVDCSSTPLKQN